VYQHRKHGEPLDAVCMAAEIERCTQARGADKGQTGGVRSGPERSMSLSSCHGTDPIRSRWQTTERPSRPKARGAFCVRRASGRRTIHRAAHAARRLGGRGPAPGL